MSGSLVGAILSLIGFVALTAGTALFVASEFALTALERSLIEENVRTVGDRRSTILLRAHQTLSFQLSGAQLGITITTLVTGFLAEPVLARFFVPVLTSWTSLSSSTIQTISMVVALILATALSMVYGELVPKNYALTEPLKTARWTIPFLTAFSAVMSWAIHALNGTANAIVRLMGIEPIEELESARSPEELGALVRTSAEEGALSQATATLLDRSLQFGEFSAEDLMTPRSTVHYLNADDTVVDLIRMAELTGHSRFPVVETDLDETIGIVHVKQVFTIPDHERSITPVRTLIHDAASVPDSLDGDSVLERVRASGWQIVLVVDEYGGTAGIITIEDIIEEILGDVKDEYDSANLEIERTADGWECSGLLRLDEIEHAVGYHARQGEHETIGGLIMEQLGRIPEVDDIVVLPVTDSPHTDEHPEEEVEWVARVLEMDGRRVDRLLLSPIVKVLPRTDTKARMVPGHRSAESRLHSRAGRKKSTDSQAQEGAE